MAAAEEITVEVEAVAVLSQPDIYSLKEALKAFLKGNTFSFCLSLTFIYRLTLLVSDKGDSENIAPVPFKELYPSPNTFS